MLLAHLHAHIAAVRSWVVNPALSVPATLGQIHALHATLADLLLVLDSQTALGRATNGADRLLDAFLLLADVHQGFQEAVLDLRRYAAEAAPRSGEAIGRSAGPRRSSPGSPPCAHHLLLPKEPKPAKKKDDHSAHLAAADALLAGLEQQAPVQCGQTPSASG